VPETVNQRRVLSLESPIQGIREKSQALYLLSRDLNA